MFESLSSEWSRLSELLSTYHDLPTFLPEEYIKHQLLPAVLIVAVCCTIVYVIALIIVERYVPAKEDALKKAKVCYQITNILFNLCVGSLGLYIEYVILPSHPISKAPSYERAIGLVDETYLLSALQLGYQIWAIPVGFFHVNESIEMLFHHLAVVISTSLSGFLTIGFRYYVSFFYGVMELSSLPLSVMNSFKDNKEWQKKFPKGYMISRVIFAASFLYIRVYLCAFKWPVFLRDNFIVFYTKEMGIFKFYFFVQWSLAAFLAYLQLFWASLILKGIFKMIFPKKSDKKSKSE